MTAQQTLRWLAILAFWTQDHDQIARLMARSGLHRDKWERADYRQRTIAKALHRDAVYEPAGITSQQSDCSGESADNTDVADPQGVQDSAILDDIEAFLARYVAYPSEHARIAHVLWIAHTPLMDVWDSTPRIAFLSPEPASGKTRALEVTELLVPRPVEAINVTAAYLFRKVDDPDGAPTILFDEIDTVFGPKAREHEDVRGLLNAGHRKGAVAGRCIVRGKSVETVEFPAYCAVAMAGLGDLPDTILTRSVNIRMRRRAKSEKVEPFRRRVALPKGHKLRDRIAAWAARIEGQVAGSGPTCQPGSRTATPTCGKRCSRWPTPPAGRGPSAPVRLLWHSSNSPRRVRQASASGSWLTYRRCSGPRHDDHRRHPDCALRPLRGSMGGVRRRQAPQRPRSRQAPGRVRHQVEERAGEKVVKGYAREDLLDAWERYLPSLDGADTEGPNRNRRRYRFSISPRKRYSRYIRYNEQQWGIAQRGESAQRRQFSLQAGQGATAVAVVDVTRAFRYITPTGDEHEGA